MIWYKDIVSMFAKSYGWDIRFFLNLCQRKQHFNWQHQQSSWFPKCLSLFLWYSFMCCSIDHRWWAGWEGCSAAWKKHRGSWLCSVWQCHHDGPLHWSRSQRLHAWPRKSKVLLCIKPVPWLYVQCCFVTMIPFCTLFQFVMLYYIVIFSHVSH